jgi:hypothetical protein
MREGLAIGIGALLGVTTATGALVAFTADDPGTKRMAAIVSGVGLATAAGIGALLLRTPSTRPEAAFGAIGFFGLPAAVMTGFIQNERDFPK